MPQAFEFFPLEEIGLDTPPGSPSDDQWWMSGPTGSTPDGAWSAFTPPFVAYYDTTIGQWTPRSLQLRDIYYDKTNKTFWTPVAGGYIEAQSNAITTGVAYATDTDYAVVDGVSIVIVTNTSATNLTVTLPDITGLLFPKLISVIADENSGGGFINVAPFAGTTIGGVSSFTFDRENDSIQIVSDDEPTTKTWQPLFYSGHSHRLNNLDGGIASIDLYTTANVTADLNVTADQNVTANGDVTAGDDVTATDDVTSGDDVTATGEVTTNTVSERTAAAGVTIDGVLLKDSQVSTDTINEKTAAAGVTIDGVLIKDGTVAAANIGLKWRSGQKYYTMLRGVQATAATSAGSGAINYTPYRIPNAITLTGLEVDVVVPQAGSTCRMGLFADNGTGLPGALIKESSTVATTGAGLVPHTFATAYAAIPGIYWTGLRSSNAATTYNGLTAAGCNALLGDTLAATDYTTTRTSLTESGAYGAFPANATPNGASGGTTALVAILA